MYLVVVPQLLDVKRFVFEYPCSVDLEFWDFTTLSPRAVLALPCTRAVAPSIFALAKGAGSSWLPTHKWNSTLAEADLPLQIY